MTDHRNREQRLLDAIFAAPQAEIDACNEAYSRGRDHGMSDVYASVEQLTDHTPAGRAFWRGVEDGTRSVQRLLDALGSD